MAQRDRRYSPRWPWMSSPYALATSCFVRADEPGEVWLQAPLARHFTSHSLPAWLYLQRGAVSATLTTFASGKGQPTTWTSTMAIPKLVRKCNVEITECTNPWTKSMRPHKSRTLSSDVLGAQTLTLLTIAWAPNTATTYGIIVQR
jgi:hypothetical protein